jgi:glycosyltransferase involved in cell wall biosynthesis
MNSASMRASGGPQPDLTVIVPVFNEAGNVVRLFARLREVLDGLDIGYEIVCVDDGSSDTTVPEILAERNADPRIKLVELSRNFGKELALTAGLRHSAGRAVIMIDADLQHPPELIPELLAKWREGWEMVIAVRRSRDTDSMTRRLYSRGFYWLFRLMSETKIRADAGDYRLLDRKVVDVLNAMPEHTRFMKGLYSWVGFRQTIVPFDPAPRLQGGSKFHLFKLWRLAVDGLTSFTSVPLQMWTGLGFIAAAIGLGYGLYIIVKTLILGIDVPGYASLMVAVLFFGGVQLLTLGIFGEYLGRVFTEVKNRPLYVVRDAHGIEQGVDDKVGPVPRA